MKSLTRLLELRAEKRKELRNLIDTVEKRTDNPEFTEDEQKTFDDGTAEIEKLNEQITRAEKVEKLKEEKAKDDAPKAKSPQESPEEKIAKRFSFTKAINERLNGGQLTGVEKEIWQEANKEANDSGVSISGRGVAVPSWMMDLRSDAERKQDRALSVGSAASAGNLVETEIAGHVPALTPRMQVMNLGAQVMSGLRGNIDLTKETNFARADWAGEVASASEKTLTTDLIELRPKRLTAKSTFSKQLIIQSSQGVERMVRGDLERSIQLAVDLAALNGTGLSNQPTGVLNMSNIGIVYAGGADLVGTNANGAALIYDDIIKLETAIAAEDADVMDMAYITTPGAKGALKTTKIDAGSGQFVWPVGSQELNGYKAVVSTQMPSNLEKGASGTTLHSMIFGDWRALILANWAGLDLVIDEISLADTAQVKIVVHSWWDINTRHEEKFAAIKDIIV